ncbi:PepSY domain-containing protein [Vibrio cholerae]|nr:PepSY domain-containing protein [Vibrio cholerae]
MQFSYRIDKKNSNNNVTTSSSVISALSESDAISKIKKKYGDKLVRIISLKKVGDVNKNWCYRVKVKNSGNSETRQISGTVLAPNSNEAIRNIQGKYKDKLVEIIEVR